MSKISILIFSIFVIGAIVYFDLKGDYKESYRIKSVKCFLFESKGIDSVDNCIQLKAIPINNRAKYDSVVIGIQFEFEFINNRKDWIWNTFFKDPTEGSNGHIDTIEELRFQIPKQKILNLNSNFNEAVGIKLFKVHEFSINGHSVSSWNDCYVPKNYESIGLLVDDYNKNNKVIAGINDLKLFSVKDSATISALLRGDVLLNLDVKPGLDVITRIN